MFYQFFFIDRADKQQYTENENDSRLRRRFMADIIIIAVLGIVAFLVIRARLHKMRSGSCHGGCSGSCSSCSTCSETEQKK